MCVVLIMPLYSFLHSSHNVFSLYTQPDTFSDFLRVIWISGMHFSEEKALRTNKGGACYLTLCLRGGMTVRPSGIMFCVWLGFLFVLFCFYEKRFLCSLGAWPGTSSCRPGWPQTHRDLFGSTSQVLGLKACTTTARLLRHNLRDRKGQQSKGLFSKRGKGEFVC